MQAGSHLDLDLQQNRIGVMRNVEPGWELKQNSKEGKVMKIIVLLALFGIITLLASGCASPSLTTIAYSRYQEVGDARGPIPVPTSSTVPIGSLSLPAGNYEVTASLYFSNDSPDEGIAYCILQVGGRNAQAIDSLPGHKGVSQALTVASELSSSGTAMLSCRNNGNGGNLHIETFNLNAIKVWTLTFQ